jgi:hypothetical protein
VTDEEMQFPYTSHGSLDAEDKAGMMSCEAATASKATPMIVNFTDSSQTFARAG